MSYISCNDDNWHSYTLPKEDPKNILLTSTFFHWKSADFALPRNTDIDCIWTHNFYYLNVFESLTIFWINLVGILMMSAKLATVALVKIKTFYDESCDVIISVSNPTKRILSRDSNYFLNVDIWPKFRNSSITVREVILTLIL